MRTPGEIGILYEDRDLIVIDKPAGLLTEQTRRKETLTLENAVNFHIRKGQSRSSRHVWLVHRLDRDTSGVIVFAKTEEACDFLKSVWHESVTKKYLAAVWGVPDPKSGSLEGYLLEDKNLYVRQILKPKPDEIASGVVKFARTDYETIAVKHDMALVSARLHTGRRNQIRVQFAAVGHPLVGDLKYGPNARPFRERMCLHAQSIEFPHPVTRKQMKFTSPTPDVFTRLFR